jgi:hypothetical protein
MHTATQSSHSYDFRGDFGSITRPGLIRYRNACADVFGDEFNAEKRGGTVTDYARTVWRILKSVQNNFHEHGIRPSSDSQMSTWTAESATALAEEFADDAIDATRRAAGARSNPLTGVAKIGLDAHALDDFRLLEDALGLINTEDKHLFDIHDRAEASKRAQSLRLLGFPNDDVDSMLQNFVRKVVSGKKAEPWKRPVYSPRADIIPRSKPRPKPITLDKVTVGQGADWTDSEGLLREMTDWISATSRRPNLPLASAASFAVLSAVCGGRLYAPTGAPLTLYIACLGDTGIGKDRPLKAIPQILHAAGLGGLHSTASAFTISGLEQILVDAPICIATVDEIAVNLLARMTNKRAGANETQMKGFFLSLFGQGIDHPPYKLMKRARASLPRGIDLPTEVQSPSLSLFGVSTLEAFYETVTAGSVTDGFLNRFLIASADPRSDQTNDIEEDKPVPTDVIDWLKQVATTGDNDKLVFVDGNVRRVKPRRVNWSQEAKERYETLDKEILSVMDAKPTGHELLARIPEYALRLSCLHAISRHGPEAAMVEWQDIDVGTAWAIESAHAMMDGAANSMNRSEHEAKVNAVKAIIRKASPISQNDLVRATQQIHPRDRDAIIQQLADGGVIGVEKVEGASRGRKPTVYVWRG